MVRTTIVVPWCSEVTSLVLNAAMAEELFVITVEHYTILSGIMSANGIVRERFGRVEVEDKQQSSPLKCDNLVLFVLARNIRLNNFVSFASYGELYEQAAHKYLRGAEPIIMGLCNLHSSVPFVKIFVTQQLIIHYIPLSTSIMETGIVSISREIEPFRMAKFIAFKVQVSLAAQGMCNQSKRNQHFHKYNDMRL